jgi:hypothetical protein
VEEPLQCRSYRSCGHHQRKEPRDCSRVVLWLLWMLLSHRRLYEIPPTPMFCRVLISSLTLAIQGLVTYCCPCVTFGKIHHRLVKNNSMEGYEPVNTSVCSLSPFFSFSPSLSLLPRTPIPFLTASQTVPHVPRRRLLRPPLGPRVPPALGDPQEVQPQGLVHHRHRLRLLLRPLRPDPAGEGVHRPRAGDVSGPAVQGR